MPTIPYKDSKGTRLPGVTTVISNLGWSTNQLMYWAWDQGMKGLNFRDTSQSACDVGTLVHSYIECDIHGTPPPVIPPEFEDQVSNAVLGWMHWRDMSQFKPLRTEVSLVSDKLKFGGTMDLAAVIGRPVLADLKSSKGIYPNHKIQIASYGWLWDNADLEFIDGEWRPWKPEYPLEGLALLQVGKEDGSFHYHFWHELSQAWEVFQHLLAIHKLKKALS